MQFKKAGLFLIFILAMSLTAPATPQAQADTTDTFPITSDADDGLRYTPNGFLISFSYTGLTGGAVANDGFYRFTDISIPQGATIVSAKLIFICETYYTGVVVNTRILAEHADNPNAITSFVDYTNRVKTTAFKDWDAIPIWSEHLSYESPDIANVISDVIEEAWWDSGDAIQIFWMDHGSSGAGNSVRRPVDFSAAETEPRLEIVWNFIEISPPSDPNHLFGAGFNATSPYVDLQWNHSLVDVQFFEIQNSSDSVSWAYLGQSTTANYTDTQVVNGTKRYYRVRAVNQTEGTWYNSSWADVNFEKVHFIPGTEVVGPTVYVDVNITGAWVEYNLTSINVNVGTHDAGNLASTFVLDGDTYDISETVGAPAWLISFNWTNVDQNANSMWVVLYSFYSGNQAHDIDLQLYNFTSTSWADIAHMPDMVGFEWINASIYDLRIPNDFINSTGAVLGRIIHVDAGNINHDILIDFLRLQTFIPFEEADPEWLDGWDLRVKLTIDHNDIDDALSDFPVLIYISDSSGINNEDVTFIFDEVGANSLKIAVTEDDGITECYVEVEKWDLGNEQAWLHSKIPSSSSSVDTDIYLYYDNEHADNDAYVGITNSVVAENVWDSNFLMVQHQAGAASPILDSTGNDIDMTAGGNPAYQQVGPIDGEIDYDGNDSHLSAINVFDAIVGTDKGTMSLWIKTTDVDGVNALISLSIEGAYMINFRPGEGGLLKTYWSGTQSDAARTTTQINTGAQFYIVSTYDGANQRVYVNGVLETTDACNLYDITGLNRATGLGSHYTGTFGINADLDEVRVSKLDRAPAWIKASFESGVDDLLDWGSQESECPPVDGTLPVDDYSIIFLAMGLIFCLAIYFLYTRNK